MKYFFLLGLLVLPVIISVFNGGITKSFVSATDVEDDEDMQVENEETAIVDDGKEEVNDETDNKGGSKFADTTILFVKPTLQPGLNLELPAGKIVEFLVGFLNKGQEDMVLETLDASFRYPMDYNYNIQNFSTLAYEKTVKPGDEATLAYSFIPADSLASRPVQLTVNLRYRDSSGNQFYEGIYNQTNTVIDSEEGFDGETFFLYVFLSACVLLSLVLGHQFLMSVGKKRVSTSTKRPAAVETGTSNHDDVDYDWLPRETLQSLNKSPRGGGAKPSKQQSPRQRKTKRSAGSDD